MEGRDFEFRYERLRSGVGHQGRLAMRCSWRGPCAASSGSADPRLHPMRVQPFFPSRVGPDDSCPEVSSQRIRFRKGAVMLSLARAVGAQWRMRSASAGAGRVSKSGESGAGVRVAATVLVILAPSGNGKSECAGASPVVEEEATRSEEGSECFDRSGSPSLRAMIHSTRVFQRRRVYILIERPRGEISRNGESPAEW